ncbi:MAG: ABC transporter ATP-binding protein [Anaerolineales bacterium]|nr:ABC transporter ATP-binding protein [Anaerolineales bacterium]
MALLEIQNLTKSFYGIPAVDHLNLSIERGEVTGLIGPNGSGKTTIFNCITRHLESDEGVILFKGKDITHTAPYRLALSGLTRTFQTIRVFSELTVLENLLVALQQHQEDSVISRLLRSPSIRKFERVAREKADEALEFVELTYVRDLKAGHLSYGQRKLLALASCFVFEPDIILLDEPTAAVNPTMINKIKEHIRILNQKGITFFIIEHNMEFIMDLARRIIVLEQGQKIAEGEPRDIQTNEMVLEAYFGR